MGETAGARRGRRARARPGPVRRAGPVGLAWLLGLAGLLAVPAAAAGPGYEPLPVLAARDLAPGVPLRGPRYTVEDAVTTDGFLARFTIRSDFGTFEARGPGMLERRLGEIAALEALEGIQTEEAVVQGARDGGQALGRDLGTLATRPVETVKAIPTGVARFFERTADATRRGVQQLGDARAARQGAPAPAGPGARLPGAPEGAPPGGPDPGLARAAARAAGRTTLDLLGYDEVRRGLAKRLGVDPYTTNPVLRQRLDDVAWAAFAGHLGVDLVRSVVPLARVLSATVVLTEWVWDTPPAELRLALGRALLALGAPQADADRFLRHGAYTLTLQAALVRALERMPAVPGRAGVLPLAVTVVSEEQARFVVGAAELLARYHETVEPVVRVEVRGTLLGRTRDGVVLPAPVDYLSWTESLERLAGGGPRPAPRRRTLWLTGQVSPRAREELARLGWTVRESAAGPPR
jgi:hypothetical protein